MAVQALDPARLPIDWQRLALLAALIAVAYGLIPAYASSYLVEAILLPFLALSLAA
ncbi:branched-chain amino acid ABC transporter permease, partial [Mesorhizobium sp. M0598]